MKGKAYAGVRTRLRGTLGKIKLNVHLDFGFGDVVVPEPIRIELPDLLGLGAPRLLGYTRESAIAEKFQALVALDILNTRIKDFYDIWSLSRGMEFEGAILARAIAATFGASGYAVASTNTARAYQRVQRRSDQASTVESLRPQGKT